MKSSINPPINPSIKQSTHINIALPVWLNEFIERLPTIFATPEQQMQLVIDAANHNIDNKTGGPFAAAIFDQNTHALISLGVNLVSSQNISMLHAEMLAITLAQQALNTFDLSTKGDFTLVTSCEPCAMCFGAIPWSGVTKVICGATESDARAVGFDEGDKPKHWQQSLIKRGINVQCHVKHAQAAHIFTHYQQLGGLIYNANTE
jgi:tRNA(Arg) A34 adenosine deaminase TadA